MGTARCDHLPGHVALTRSSPRRWMHTLRPSRLTVRIGTMALRASPCHQTNCTFYCTGGAGGGCRAEGVAEAQRRELGLHNGAGDGNRTRTISLGIRPIQPSDRPDLDIRCTASDRHGPLDTRVNGPPMARGPMVSAVVRRQRAELHGRPCSLVPIVDVTSAPTLSSGYGQLRRGRRQRHATPDAWLAWLIT